MRKVGVTTVQRWLSEPLEEGVTAYVQSEGLLQRLGPVTGEAGKISVDIWMPYKRNPPPDYGKGQDNYTLQSTVYLYASKDDLAGLAVDSVEFADLGMTIACVNAARAVGERIDGVGTTMGLSRYGEAANPQVPCHPHCG